MQQLTAAQKYVGNLYEACVDRGLDLGEIRLELLASGLPPVSSLMMKEWDQANDQGRG